jgi:hypothetical protein
MKAKRAPQSRDIVGKLMDPPRCGRHVADAIKVVKAIDAAMAAGDIARAEHIEMLLNTRGVKPAYLEAYPKPVVVSTTAEPKDFNKPARLIKQLVIELCKIVEKKDGRELVEKECQLRGIDYLHMICECGQGAMFVKALCQANGWDYEKCRAAEARNPGDLEVPGASS